MAKQHQQQQQRHQQQQQPRQRKAFTPGSISKTLDAKPSTMGPQPAASSTAPTKHQVVAAPRSTRLYVQNLPAYVDSKRLREHFTAQGEVTDAVVVKTKDGAKSRRFGFVGFKDETQAASAKAFFDQSFMDTCRLNVSFAVAREGAQAGDVARPWSKHSVGSSRYEELAKEKEAKAGEEATKKTTTTGKSGVVGEDDEKSAEFKEFMETMQTRSKSKFWANDDVQGPAGAMSMKADADEVDKLLDDSDDEGDEVHEMPVSDNEEEDGESDDDDEKLRKGGKPSKKSAALSDLDFLRSKVNKNLDKDGDEDMGEELLSDSEDEKFVQNKKKTKSADGTKVVVAAEAEKEEEEEEEEETKPTARLFVRNLPFTAVEEDLTDLLSAYGEIVEVHMPLDETRRRKGFGFVLFKNTVDAQTALEKLNGFAFQGRRLHVIYARTKPEKLDPQAMLENPNLTYKQKKELERQISAAKQTGWNASFIRGDATVGTLAERMGVQRGDILDKETGNMAVRLAIGETMLVKENKEFFAEQGVDLDAIEGALVKPGATRAAKAKIERSTSVILVKNLPHTTQEDELAQLFRKHGDLGRFLLAPSKTLALVEFFEPSEARRAFRSLAYKKFQHVPLYLEWAPVKVFTAKATPGQKTSAGVKQTSASALGIQDVDDVDAHATNGDDGDNGDSVGGNAATDANNTICVKNLSFNTNEPGLQKLFERVGKLRKVTVARRKDPKRGMLSMGFGFVEFADAKDAEKAIATLQATVLDGHALNLRISQKKVNNSSSQGNNKRKTTGDDGDAGAATGRQTKIMARNVAFEATSNEIRELFGAFGQLKRVRMPKKFDGNHRGFAFVEFLTEQEAKSAFRALSSSHLYGRHLVLEWAEDADDMDTLRAKAGKDLHAIQEGERRKRVKKNQDELREAQDGKDDGDY